MISRISPDAIFDIHDLSTLTVAWNDRAGRRNSELGGSPLCVRVVGELPTATPLLLPHEVTW